MLISTVHSRWVSAVISGRGAAQSESVSKFFFSFFQPFNISAHDLIDSGWESMLKEILCPFRRALAPSEGTRVNFLKSMQFRTEIYLHCGLSPARATALVHVAVTLWMVKCRRQIHVVSERIAYLIVVAA